MHELQVHKFWGLIEDELSHLPHGQLNLVRNNNLKPATQEKQGLNSYGMFVGKELPTIVLGHVV